MMGPMCITLNQQLHKKYKDFFELADECFELSNNVVIPALEALKLKQDQLSKYQIILGANFYKAQNSFLSIMYLCNEGLVGDAESLVRKLIELTVTLKYISQDIDDRIEKYWHHAALIDYDWWKKLVNKNFRPVSNDKFVKKYKKLGPDIEKAYNEAKKFYGLDKNGEETGKFLHNWSGLGFEKMAVKCGMPAEIIPYKLYCIPIHASVKDIPEYFNFQNFSFDPNISREDDIPVTIIQAVRMYLLIVELVIDEFNLGLIDSLSDVRQHLESFKDFILSGVQDS